jgi:hypothetical protein
MNQCFWVLENTIYYSRGACSTVLGSWSKLTEFNSRVRSRDKTNKQTAIIFSDPKGLKSRQVIRCKIGKGYHLHSSSVIWHWIILCLKDISIFNHWFFDILSRGTGNTLRKISAWTLLVISLKNLRNSAQIFSWSYEKVVNKWTLLITFHTHPSFSLVFIFLLTVLKSMYSYIKMPKHFELYHALHKKIIVLLNHSVFLNTVNE